MSAAPEKLAQLRHLLAARFPTTPRAPGRTLHTGIPALDESTGGGLPLGAITEIVCAAPSCGSRLFLHQLLARTRDQRQRVALIDSTDSFDPDSTPPDLLVHLLWVRCTGTTPALQAADLLARDANFGLVILDLRGASESDLRRIPGPQWYRFQRAVEPTDLALVVQTPRPSVPSAQLRLAFAQSHTPTAFEIERAILANRLAPILQRQRLQIATG
ncbi:MAG: hypothetical protein ABIZ49_08685 [Opitutaceae bacterium]